MVLISARGGLRLVAAVAVFGASWAVRAETALKASDVVNVRSGPGTGYGDIGDVPAGHVYAGIAKSGDWWKIGWNGGVAWTHGGYYTSPAGLGAVKAAVEALNVRSGPGTGYAILGQIYMGQVYAKVQADAVNGWYRIYWGGRAAYVAGSYVTGVTLAGASAAPPPAPVPVSNLAMAWYKQVNGYYCGPTTVQMTAKFLTGTLYSQYTIAAYLGTDGNGTYVSAEGNGLRRYASPSYKTVTGFARDGVVANINRSAPVPINFNTRYVSYWGGYSAGHYSPIKGYTSGGYYIHDSWKGADRWASNTEVWNAVHYHHGYWYRIY